MATMGDYFNTISTINAANSIAPNTYQTWQTASAAGSATTTGQIIWSPQTVDWTQADGSVSTEDVKVLLFADARTIKAALQKQIEVLESLQDGLEGIAVEAISDAIFFIKESIESLEKVSSGK